VGDADNVAVAGGPMGGAPTPALPVGGGAKGGPIEPVGGGAKPGPGGGAAPPKGAVGGATPAGAAPGAPKGLERTFAPAPPPALMPKGLLMAPGGTGGTISAPVAYDGCGGCG